jgi:hypothetical protein
MCYIALQTMETGAVILEIKISREYGSYFALSHSSLSILPGRSARTFIRRREIATASEASMLYADGELDRKQRSAPRSVK